MAFALYQSINTCRDVIHDSPCAKVGLAVADGALAVTLIVVGILSLCSVVQIPPFASYAFIAVGGGVVLADIITSVVGFVSRRALLHPAPVSSQEEESSLETNSKDEAAPLPSKVKMTRGEFVAELDKWVSESGDYRAYRLEARKKILQCYDKKSTKLALVALNLTSLPNCIGSLVDLTELILHHNKLRFLPNSLGKLVNLRELGLNENKLNSLPDCIGKLVNLRKLDLDENQLNSLPDCIGKLVNLTELNLYDNKLASLPATLGNLVNLKNLNLSRNRLAFLPDCIRKLVNLTWLDLNRNQLESLPDWIGNLVKLEMLNLWHNNLSSLPATLSKLDNLEMLTLSHNRLTTSSYSHINFPEGCKVIN